MKPSSVPWLVEVVFCVPVGVEEAHFLEQHAGYEGLARPGGQHGDKVLLQGLQVAGHLVNKAPVC